MESLSNKILLNICTIKEFAVGLQFCVVSKFLSSRGTFERLLVKGKAKGHYTPLTMSPAAPPPQEFNKHTRACLRCKLVKTFDQVSRSRSTFSITFLPFDHYQFLTDGCENCDTLNLKNNTELVSQSTTNEYSGYGRANSTLSKFEFFVVVSFP